ncbi:protein XRI1-like [Andrographis paniculata]|uniref:protein XRI1-like n=1 Tax=Andrographis paniculata TaxID=175694 RepID=UPI0021E83444|nr:protein XRI1-like [Andrographis paniculata]
MEQNTDCNAQRGASGASDEQIDIPGLSENTCRVRQSQSIHTPGEIVSKGGEQIIGTPKKHATSLVVSPFSFVKSSSLFGDTTINDINERINAPPPIYKKDRRESSEADSKSELSGKPVVSKTKFVTGNGKGSVTIVRRKG